MKLSLTLIALVLLLMLVLSACSPLSTLQTIVDVTAEAIPILEAAGVPIPPQVATYVADVAGCIAGQTGTPSPSQLATIGVCLVSQIVPSLTGLPPGVADIIAKIAKAVETFLQQHTPSSAKKLAGSQFSANDAQRFTELRARAKDTQTRARALVKK